MTQRRLNGDFALILLSIAVVCAHPILYILLPAYSLQVSYVFFLGANAAALAVSLWRSLTATRGMRVKWALLAAGFLFWLIADCMDAFSVFVQHSMPVSATLKDFIYFFFSIPILITIAMPEEGEETTIPLFVLLDALQVLAVGYLIYAALFSVLPFSGQPEQPISETAMNLVYDVEDIVLTLLATARLLFGLRGAQDRRFFQVLVPFLWIYGLCIYGYNHLLPDNSTTLGWLDVLITLPFVVFTLGALLVDRLPVLGAEFRPLRPIMLTIDNARPILLSLALVTLCGIVAGRHLQAAMGFTAGAFLIYGIRSIVLQTRFRQAQFALEEAHDRLSEIALQDGLTGIPNRRCFDQRLDSEWSRAQRHNRPLSLLLIDVDHFKKINDTHGHLTGDECLKHLAQLFRSTLHRAGDIAARYGGEEFAILLPEADTANAILVAEKIRAALAKATPSPACPCSVTVSIGVSTWEPADAVGPQEAASIGQLIHAADKALYQAKQSGRDRIESLEIQALAASSENMAASV